MNHATQMNDDVQLEIRIRSSHSRPAVYDARETEHL
jgi:hypothetical protein